MNQFQTTPEMTQENGKRPFSEKNICQKVATFRPSRLRQIEQNYFSQFKVRVLVELLLQQEARPVSLGVFSLQPPRTQGNSLWDYGYLQQLIQL